MYTKVNSEGNNTLLMYYMVNHKCNKYALTIQDQKIVVKDRKNHSDGILSDCSFELNGRMD